MSIKTLQKLLLTALVFLTMAACQMTNQTKTALNLANCEFRLVSAENIVIAGISIENYTSVKDLGVGDFAMFMGALTQPELPLSLQLNIEVKNPNPAPAGINSLDYIVIIDDIQMLQGSYTQPITVPASSSAVIPVQLNVDLKQALKGKSMDAILNFGFNLAGVGHQPTRFKLKLKPSILVGSTVLAYPAYITVKTEYQNGNVVR